VKELLTSLLALLTNNESFIILVIFGLLILFGRYVNISWGKFKIIGGKRNGCPPKFNTAECTHGAELQRKQQQKYEAETNLHKTTKECFAKQMRAVDDTADLNHLLMYNNYEVFLQDPNNWGEKYKKVGDIFSDEQKGYIYNIKCSYYMRLVELALISTKFKLREMAHNNHFWAKSNIEWSIYLKEACSSIFNAVSEYLNKHYAHEYVDERQKLFKFNSNITPEIQKNIIEMLETMRRVSIEYHEKEEYYKKIIEQNTI